MFKSSLLKIGTVVIFLLIAYLVFLYFSIRTNDKDVSGWAPYHEILNKELTLVEDAIIVRNLDEFSQETPYLLLAKDVELFEGVQKLFELPQGNQITFTSAKHFHNGVSGFTSPMLFGEIENPQGELIFFEHQWGEQKMTLDADEPLQFSYPKALWQEAAFEGYHNF